MTGIKLTFLVIGSLGVLAGGGVEASAWLGRNKKVESEVSKELESDKKETEKLWEYVFIYGEKREEEMCDFLEDGQQKSNWEKKKSFESSSEVCQTSWSKEIISFNKGKKGLWMQGDKNLIDEILKKNVFDWTEFQKKLLSGTEANEGIKDLSDSCKVKEETQKIFITCQ